MSAGAIADAYDASATAWADGPDRVYGPLADQMLRFAPVDIAGKIVLDLGAGTGTATRAALAAGASMVIAVDLSAEMLRTGPPSPDVWPVVADATALPFRTGAFDLVAAACCLGHLADPILGLSQAARVSSALVATAFAADWTHPAKSAVDEAMRGFGFVPPDWYVALKHDTEPLVADPTGFAALAVAAGWQHVEVTAIQVPTGLTAPADLVDWRCGMAHLAPFVATLGPARRAEARRAAELALAGAAELVVPLLILTARNSRTAR